MSNKGVLLQVDNISKIYTSGVIFQKQINAVKNVSFEIKKGQIVSLVGESGSGKTTISNLLLRLLTPTEGHIFLKGKDIFNINKINYHKQVQVIFQDPYSSINYFYKIDRVLYRAFNLRKDLRITKQAKRDMIIDTLDSIGLNADEVLGRYPHQLSGGQLQRFLIARVLLINPDLLIADEPTSMIDASSRAGVLNLLLKLREEQDLSILFITHDIGQAQYISDDIMVMKDGELVEKGPCNQVLIQPQHSYTKFLVSCVPSLHQKWILEHS